MTRFAMCALAGVWLASCGNSSSSTGPLPVYTDFVDGTCANGRIKCGAGCVDPYNHPQNCGTCGNVCAGGQVCVGGQCTASCPAGQTVCDGLCVSTSTSALHCGACGMACANGQVCSNATCVAQCPANQVPATPFSNDGPPRSCVGLAGDSNNCGAVGNVCKGGTACGTDACTMTCSGSANCSGVCTDLSSNANHCGSCDSACGPTQVCVNGACAASCPAGLTECARACVDTNHNPHDCGRCFQHCATEQTCAHR